MASQIHRRFTHDQVKLLLELYNKKAISLGQVLQHLECRRSRFYQILKAYRHEQGEFTVAYGRNYPQHRLSKKIERVIREKLEMDRQLIGDKETPLWGNNYAAARDEVVKRLGCRLSAQTVRSRAKKSGFHIPKIKNEKSPPHMPPLQEDFRIRKATSVKRSSMLALIVQCDCRQGNNVQQR